LSVDANLLNEWSKSVDADCLLEKPDTVSPKYSRRLKFTSSIWRRGSSRLKYFANFDKSAASIAAKC
jgi:hypothetical protein